MSRRLFEILAIVIGVFLLFLGGSCYLDKVKKDAVKEAKLEGQILDKDSVIALLMKARDSAGVRHDSTVITYQTIRDRIKATDPTNKPAIILGEACDQVILTCAAKDSISQGIIRNQADEIKMLKARGKVMSPRFNPYGMLGANVLGGGKYGQPLAQVGVEYQIRKNFSVTAFLQAKRDSGQVKTDAVVAGKISLR